MIRHVLEAFEGLLDFRTIAVENLKALAKKFLAYPMCVTSGGNSRSPGQPQLTLITA
jgi:hypothetical protein